jgi:hypothetical protein
MPRASKNTVLQLTKNDAGFLPRRFLSTRVRRASARPRYNFYEQPVVLPQVSHFRQVPLRTNVKFAHSGQASPT